MSQDRKQLIRLAASRPVGDPVRRVLLGELQKQSDAVKKHKKDIPKWVKKRMRDFKRVFDKVPLETRAKAKSFDDILELVEGDPSHKQIMRIEESLRNDWLDAAGDDSDALSAADFNFDVWDELSDQLVRAGIIGKRAK